MLSNAKLPKSFRAEVVSIVVYHTNRSSFSSINLKTSQELWTEKPLDYNNLRVFSCTAYAQTKTDKLESNAVKCVFFGYPKGVKGYKL